MAEFSDDTYKVLKALESSASFQRFLDCLKEKLYLVRKQGDTLEGVKLFHNQGKAQILSSIVEASEEAEVAVRRIDKRDLEGKGPSVSAIT